MCKAKPQMQSKVWSPWLSESLVIWSADPEDTFKYSYDKMYMKFLWVAIFELLLPARLELVREKGSH